MPTLQPDQREYITRSWSSRWKFILQTQNQIVNWIFAVHGGGIAGLLTFAASKGSTCSVKIGLGAFSLGLLLIVLFGAFMFYFEFSSFRRYRYHVEELFKDRIDWNEFLKRHEDPEKYLTCEFLAWVSGICGIIGLIAAFVAIL